MFQCIRSINVANNSGKYPLLSQIEYPSDLRKLPVDRLPQVCSELRSFLIDSLSENPGHFASSMGAVEITVALHYVYDTPYDRIVWDVGHQAYSHKLLTGRREAFSTNRKHFGLSGFPNPEESEYDSFIAGHASNSISAALGMAKASELKGEPRRNVIAVIGDASIAGGLAFEGLNNAASARSNLLIVLNDNDMAIANNVGSLNKYLVNINTSKSYNAIRYKLYKAFRKFHLITENHRGIILRFNNSMKALISRQQNIFEGLNIRYFGPYDGHDVIRLVRVFSDLKDMNGPILLHLRTIKGKGYKPAEESPCVWHAPGKFNRETGERVKSTDDGRLRYQDVFGQTLVELARENEKIVGITAAMPTGCSMTYMQEAFPTRAFDVGISEGHAVTFSGGLAKDGMIPFCCIYSTFLQRGFDEIIHDVAIQNLPVIFCIDRAGLVGEDGVTHHGSFDLAYLREIPNMTIASPLDERMLRNLMYTAQLRADGPFAIRYPRGKCEHKDWKSPMEEVAVGKGQKLRDGDKIAVLSLGPIGNMVGIALDELKSQGICVAHYDMTFLKPLDEELVRDAAIRYKHIITVEDGCVIGGLGSAVADSITTHNYNVTLHKVGVPDKFVKQGSVSELYADCHMDRASLIQLINEILENEKA